MKDAIILMLLKLLGNLPLAVAQVLGAGVGWLMWCSGSRAARVTETNLALCYTDMSATERRRLARQSLLESGRLAAEIPVVWRRSNAWLQKKVKTVHGSDLLSAALAKHRGVIVLTPHLGDWEILPVLLTLQAPLIALYQPPKDKALDEYIQQVRRRPDTQLAATNRRGVAALTKALRAGQIAGILPDQVPDAGNGGVEVPFCGEPALTMTLVHKLIQRTECEVLLAYVLRVKGGFEVVISRCDDGIYSDDTYESVAAMNRTIASAVATAPAQYQWEYKRFKGREQVEPY